MRINLHKYNFLMSNNFKSYFLIITLIMTIIKADNESQSDSQQDSQADFEKPTEDSTLCGQYGFNCISERSLSFCPIILDGDKDLEKYYECEENYYCDENNPSFCTPKDEFTKALEKNKQCPLSHTKRETIDDDYLYGEDLYYRQTRSVPASVDPCELETKTLQNEETTTEEPTTVIDYEYTDAPDFDCQAFGFFPDEENNTLFWHCDVSEDGNGFFLHHMKCGADRHFDPFLRSCVLIGTTRAHHKRDNTIQKLNHTSDCLNKKPGKYADEIDCHIYHLCLSNEFEPLIQLSFMCPNKTAYDFVSRTCTIAAYNRCDVKAQPQPNNINCTSPMRFRSVDDCHGYYVCFVDNVIEIKCPKMYKFDDDSMECLPEKIANCNEYPG